MRSKWRASAIFSRNFLLVHSSHTPRSTHLFWFLFTEMISSVLELPINGKTILFCVRLLKLNRFLRLCIAVGVGRPPHSPLKSFPLHDYPFSSLYTFGLLPSLFAIMSKATTDFSTSLFADKCFSFICSECLQVELLCSRTRCTLMT